jgi:dihydroxy-acid dehydratase
MRLAVARRELQLLVANEELASRIAQLLPRAPGPKARGYRKLFLTMFTQADPGCDFDFLRAAEFSGAMPLSKP